ncbi:Bax inhibitor-1/YccA family protein [Saprospiraceae bacterium]|nr:Bax inhibitor-1/YccA family protein [Saprospiraceae bacterium]
MNILKSNNPMLNKKAVAKAIALDRDKRGNSGGPLIDTFQHMTVSGAVTKTLILTFIMLAISFVSYQMPSRMFMTVGALGSAGVYFLTSWKPHLSPITAPVYAVLQGLFVGSISAVYAMGYDGIIFQAVSATIASLLVMLMVYKSGLIKVTQKFRMVVSMLVGAIMIVYLISWVGSLSGSFQVPYLHESGAIGIGITCFILVVAALNLLLNFDSFEKGEEMQAPKHFEWYYGMGLLFTLVWMYTEFLRLLSKLQSD